jgi:hypothetical protein
MTLRLALPSCLACAAALLLLGACNNFRNRAEEKVAVFGSLDPSTRTRLEARAILVGDTPDMVYIALGLPDEKRTLQDAAGRATVWIYKSYWREYEGSRPVTYHRIVAYDNVAKSYRVLEQPDYHQPMFASRSEERLRITFRDGRVTVLDQAARD